MASGSGPFVLPEAREAPRLVPKIGTLPDLKDTLRADGPGFTLPRAADWCRGCLASAANPRTPRSWASASTVPGRGPGVREAVARAQSSSCRGAPRPGLVEKVPGPPSARARLTDTGRWPEHVELGAGAGPRGLVPRGTLFERQVRDPVEPRRTGTYEFCVVGVDFSSPGQIRYHAWEPTGHHDGTFSFDELDRTLAMERFSRCVGLAARPRTDAESACRKEGIGHTTAVRWTFSADAGSLLHARQLPEVDERGRPVLPLGSRFPPRNSTDLLGPMVLQWKRHHCKDPRQLLVLDGTGRVAAYLQDEFPQAKVTAADDPQRLAGATLKLFRERRHFPVCEQTLDRAAPAVHLPDGAVDAVVLPFVLQRLCGRDERHFLALLREALRVARGYVLLAEDAVAPYAGDAAFRRWKALLGGEWSAPVLHDGELRSGPVPDHFLSDGGGSTACARRFLLLDASTFHHSNRACRQATPSQQPGKGSEKPPAGDGAGVTAAP